MALCSSPPLISHSMHIVMCIGLDARMIEDQLQGLPFLWDPIWCPSLQRNKQQFLSPLLRQNIVA
jgi:hypothetical protein